MITKLVGINLRLLFSGQLSGAAQKKPTRLKKALTALFILLLVSYTVAVFSVSFFAELADSLVSQGLDSLYWSLAFTTMLFMAVLGTLHATETQIFESRDNHFLLALPLAPRLILLSRLAAQYLLHLLLVMLLGTAAAFAYFAVAAFSWLQLLFLLLGFVLTPFLSLTISLLVGWLVALLSHWLRLRNLGLILLSLGALGLYFYAASRFNSWISLLLLQGAQVADRFRQVLPPAHAFGLLVGEQSLYGLLLYFLYCLLPFGLVFLLLNRSFLRLTRREAALPRARGRLDDLGSRSPFVALLWREWRHYSSNALVVLNTALGPLLAFAAGLYLLVGGFDVQTLLGGLPELSGLGPFLILGLSFFATATAPLAASSLSLEGKTFGLLLGLPVKPASLLLSKQLFHFLIVAPGVVFFTLVAGRRLGLSLLWLVLLLVLVLLFTALLAALGLLVNLQLARFDYPNPVMAVKQSASVLIVILGAMLLAVLFFLPYFLFLYAWLSLLAYLGLLSLFMGLLLLVAERLLFTRGARKLTELTGF